MGYLENTDNISWKTRTTYSENTDNTDTDNMLSLTLTVSLTLTLTIISLELLLYKMGDMIFFSFFALIAFCRIFYVSVSALSVSMLPVFSR